MAQAEPSSTHPLWSLGQLSLYRLDNNRTMFKLCCGDYRKDTCQGPKKSNQVSLLLAPGKKRNHLPMRCVGSPPWAPTLRHGSLCVCACMRVLGESPR